jgi:HSP20 family molecular chaperone IbpA
MQAEIIEVMHQQVRAIHRALTGDDLPQTEVPSDPASPSPDSDEVITRRFAELAAIARSIPSVATRVPPFTFMPEVDVIAGDDAVVLEVAVCGIRREDLSVECVPGALVISGIRRAGHGSEGRLFHAEIARGPFLRMIPLPFPIERDPRVELEHGLLRIYLAVETADRGSDSRTEVSRNQRSPRENSK